MRQVISALALALALAAPSSVALERPRHDVNAFLAAPDLTLGAIENRSNGFSVQAKLASDPESFGFVTVVDGLTGAWMSTEDGVYEFFPTARGSRYTRVEARSGECLTRRTPVRNEALVDADAITVLSRRRAASSTLQYTFYVNQWYTPQVLTALGSESAVRLKMQMAIDLANLLLSRAGCSSVRVATKNVYLYNGGGESGYQEKTIADLQAFSNSADVNAKRDADHAHLSFLWHETGNSASWRPMGRFSKDLGYAIIVRLGALNYDFVHELVHMFDGDHDPAHSMGGDGVSATSTNGDPNPYGRGYIDADAGFGCLMSYFDLKDCPSGSCGSAPFISSSDQSLTYKGRPTGTPFQDNARVIRENAPKVYLYAQ